MFFIFPFFLVDVGAHGQDGGGNDKQTGVLGALVKLGIDDLKGGTALDFGVEANGDTSVNSVKELEEVASSTEDPVVNGHVINQRLSDKGKVGEFRLGQRIVQRTRKAAHSVALVKNVVLSLRVVIEIALSKVQLALPLVQTVETINVLVLGVEPTRKSFTG